jgi:hypothetical protein
MDPTWRLGASLADYAGFLFFSFLCKVWHDRHPCYLFSLFREENLITDYCFKISYFFS